MTHTIRLPALAGAIAAFFLATLAPTAVNDAVAQGGIQAPRPAYYNGYGAGHNGYGAGYNSGYEDAYRSYASGNNGYTGYGNGPYGNRPSAMFPSTFRYSYSYSYSYGNGLRYGGGNDRPIYNPNYARYYSPYGGY